jgi:hypothetical protein
MVESLAPSLEVFISMESLSLGQIKRWYRNHPNMTVQEFPLGRDSLESCVQAQRWTFLNLGSVKLRLTGCVTYLSKHRIPRSEGSCLF